MAARAIVTRYGTESVIVGSGNFQLQCWFLVTDPATFPTQQGQIGTTLVELDPASPGTWAAAVEAAVIAEAGSYPVPFTLTGANVFIPTIA